MKVGAGGKRQGAGRKRKAESAPVAHRMSDAVKSAIESMVEDDLTRKEAAEKAGLTDGALRKAMRYNPMARSFYAAEVRSLLHCLKHHGSTF